MKRHGMGWKTMGPLVGTMCFSLSHLATWPLGHSMALAQVPHLIRYQGQAVDAQGVPLEGPYTLTFRLYDAETGGVKVWEEVQPDVPLKGGHFSVLLGQMTPLASMDWSQPRWVTIQVGEEPEMSPRQPITSVPLAVRAEVAERLDGPIQLATGGNVGIGTASPQARMHSQAPAAGVSAFFNDGANSALTISHPSANVALIKSLAGNHLAFGANDAEYLRIAPSGHVGIGTTSPVGRLDLGVSSDLVGTDQVVGLRTNGSSRFGFGLDGQNLAAYVPSDLSHGNGFVFGTMSASDGTTFAERVRITTAGNVGIGTTTPRVANGAGRVLDVNNPSGFAAISLHMSGLPNKELAFSNNGNGSFIDSVGADDNKIIFRVDPTSTIEFTKRVVLLGNGNVGIGTMDPTNILTVQQGSPTDPIADSWTVYPSDRKHKRISRTNPKGYLEQVRALDVYEWTREPSVSDEEADEAIKRERKKAKQARKQAKQLERQERKARKDRDHEEHEDDDDDKKDEAPPTVAEREAKKRELAMEKARLPKFTKKRVGMSIDDANVPQEILAFNQDGTTAGIDLLAYVGYLHAALKEAVLKIEELESRLPPTRERR